MISKWAKVMGRWVRMEANFKKKKKRKEKEKLEKWVRPKMCTRAFLTYEKSDNSGGFSLKLVITCYLEFVVKILLIHFSKINNKYQTETYYN